MNTNQLIFAEDHHFFTGPYAGEVKKSHCAGLNSIHITIFFSHRHGPHRETYSIPTSFLVVYLNTTRISYYHSRLQIHGYLCSFVTHSWPLALMIPNVHLAYLSRQQDWLFSCLPIIFAARRSRRTKTTSIFLPFRPQIRER